VTETATRIGSLGEALPSRFQESHMQAVFVEALRAACSRQAPDLVVKPNRSVKFEEWPGVGPIDVSLLDKEGAPLAFIELKWGAGTLYNCIWDLAKMAVAVASKHCATAYLVAGAPASEWSSADGSALFAAGDWSTADLYTTYRKYWDFWRGDVKTHPVTLPATVTTGSVAVAELSVCGKPWEVRCGEVSAVDAEWFHVETAASPEPGISPERWREHFSWAPGDVDVLTHDEVVQILGGADEVGNPWKQDLQGKGIPDRRSDPSDGVMAQVRELATDSALPIAERKRRLEEMVCNWERDTLTSAEWFRNYGEQLIAKHAAREGKSQAEKKEGQESE